MRSIHLITNCVVFLLAFTLVLRAGDIETLPPYIEVGSPATDVIAVGPGSDGTANIVFNITSADAGFNVAFGSCPNATSTPAFATTTTVPNAPSTPAFATTTTVPNAPDGAVTKTATLNYPASQAGKSNSVSIMIMTNDEGGPCTSSLWRPRSFSQHPLASLCFAGNYLTSVMEYVASLMPHARDLGEALMSVGKSGGHLKQAANFRVLILKSTASVTKTNLPAKR